MTQLEAALAELVSLLESRSVPYALVGGLAVSAWGEARATLDVDLSVWVEPSELESTILYLCGQVRCLANNPVAFVERTRVLPVVAANNVRADIVFAALSAEKEAIDRAVAKQIGGATIAVASVEDLILMKLISERQKDIDDARRLLHRYCESLDRPYLETRLVELAEALSRPDILQVFRGEAKST